MRSALAIRLQIEASLSNRIPSALTPSPPILRPVSPTGISSIDAILDGGLPAGAITELSGAECSGRTSVALSYLARITREAKVCAWVDVSNALQPESAASAGVNLSRLLWVRCGIVGVSSATPSSASFQVPKKYLAPSPAKKGLHGGGFGSHPRSEVKGLSDAVSELLRPKVIVPQDAEPLRRSSQDRETLQPLASSPVRTTERHIDSAKPWARLDQALRVTDLLLQGGGFSAIVLDLASLRAAYSARIPLATWFRYRAAAQRTQTSLLLLTQHPCAKSSAELLLRLQPDHVIDEVTTVFTGVQHRIEVERHRFKKISNVVPLRKPPQSVTSAHWQTRNTWAGHR